MAKRETQYRGYKIEVERRGRDWQIRVSPTHPELPILHQHSFQTLVPSWEGAVDEAKRRIRPPALDHVTSIRRGFASSTLGRTRVITPSRISAVILSASTRLETRKLLR